MWKTIYNTRKKEVKFAHMCTTTVKNIGCVTSYANTLKWDDRSPVFHNANRRNL